MGTGFCDGDKSNIGTLCVIVLVEIDVAYQLLSSRTRISNASCSNPRLQRNW